VPGRSPATILRCIQRSLRSIGEKAFTRVNEDRLPELPLRVPPSLMDSLPRPPDFIADLELEILHASPSMNYVRRFTLPSVQRNRAGFTLSPV